LWAELKVIFLSQVSPKRVAPMLRP